MKNSLTVLAGLLAFTFTGLSIQAAPSTKPAAKPATPAAKPATPAISTTDPNRFTKVKEWTGQFTTGAKSSGERKEDISTVTWSSAISVEGHFTVKPFIDNRNLDPFSFRGKGEAHIVVSAKRKTQYEKETVTDTYIGDYIDTFSVEISNIDAAKGTYELSVVRDLWQDQPHKGKAIEHTSVTVNEYGTTTTTDMIDGHSWANDAGAGFGGAQPFPKQGFIIKGVITRNNDDYLGEASHWTTNWVIHPVGPEYEEPLKAVVGGPYEPERGQTFFLDAWKSTGKILSYKWSFAPADEKSPIPFNAGAAKESRRVPAVFLTAVKVTLTVSDGKKEDTDSVVISVKARDYKTPFVHREGEKIHPRSIPPRLIKGHNLAYAGGENVCAFEDYDDKDSVHILHPTSKNDSWENIGYKLQQVQDPNGPFDGDWFVTGYTLRIERQTLINKYILPGGPPPVRTAKPFYESNKALGNDVDGYLEAVRKHEKLHSELMKKALDGNDPGLQIEAWGGKDKDALKKQVDTAILTAENAISKATEDPLPVFYHGKIAFPDDATDKYVTVDMDI